MQYHVDTDLPHSELLQSIYILNFKWFWNDIFETIHKKQTFNLIYTYIECYIELLIVVSKKRLIRLW